MMPYTSYPFSRSNSAKYDPSCHVTPVIRVMLRLLIIDMFFRYAGLGCIRIRILLIGLIPLFLN